MLKALELVGFKSFADKTRFEFPPGITVVVGPNGSGKSNIVDAIKWVLGEQSAKSLRGKEMADVIFKGSGAGRKPMNAAEATIVIDNAEGRLPIDAPEVHVTRRVYRSGEGEYLINGQATRLRDIRDLFRGTGVGTDAYSIIEQGKVERLVEASPKDRRAIFEEAAGISRFKAKKVEAQRRLERVDQNLLRLSDIVEEVDNRLRSVRSQAAKARRYQEYSQRLQQLRTQVGLADWRQLTEQLDAVRDELAQLGNRGAEVSARVESCEARQLELEVEATTCSDAVRVCEGKISANRERIAGRQTTARHQRDLCRDLEEGEARYRRQLAAMSSRAGDLHQRLSETRAELEQAESDYGLVETRYRQQAAGVAELAAEVERLRDENRTRRDDYLAAMRAVAALGNRSGTLETQLSAAQATEQNRRVRLEELAGELQTVEAEVERLERQHAELARQSDETRHELDSARKVLSDSRRWYGQRQQELNELQGKLSGAAQRAAVLEELEQNQEGIGEGVKQLLAQAAAAADTTEQGDAGTRDTGPRDAAASDKAAPDAQSPETIPTESGSAVESAAVSPTVPPSADAQSLDAQFVHAQSADAQTAEARLAGPLDDVLGLVHEAIETSVELAPLIDVALGEAAHHVVLAGDRLLEAIRSGELKPQGRVGLVRLDVPATPRLTDRIDLSQHAGVLGRADRLVDAADDCHTLVARLLGTTWLVETLDAALALSRSAGHGLRFVTRSGELLDEDGTLIVGAGQASAGLVSRRSQLRALEQQIEELQRQSAQVRGEIARLEETVDRQQRRVDNLSDQQQRLAEELADHRVQHKAAEQRCRSIEKQRETAGAEAAAAAVEMQSLEQKLAETREELAAQETTVAELETTLREVDRRIETVDAQRHERETEATATKVELAKCEQRLDGLRGRMLQFEEDRAERDRAIRQARDHLADATHRRRDAEQAILEATTETAQLYLEKDALTRETARHAERRHEIAALRSELIEEVQRERKTLRRLEDQQNEKKLEAGEIRHQRSTLADRLREDYGIELAELEHTPSDEEQQERAAVEEEIASLRRKLANIGAVNMEALEELEELESRFQSLSSQYQDLTQAKQALERIIHKINADSRRLFTETLEAIRVNFQALYRKVFGGGRADIVLEEGVDVLEAGVDIISNPPGKPSFSNSLLSGGEKALTALALLLAIFQHQPSPFCVLDEVDAPWDESNIGRFIDVLHEFLSWTRFVIVTHSKKTMTAATTLYGVTMQESGVSKRVSVRFEDVSDDGHIADEALERDGQEDAA